MYKLSSKLLSYAVRFKFNNKIKKREPRRTASYSRDSPMSTTRATLGITSSKPGARLPERNRRWPCRQCLVDILFIYEYVRVSTVHMQSLQIFVSRALI